MNFVDELAVLCADAGLNHRVCKQLTDELTSAYSEPHRHYHTMHHIEQVLLNLEALEATTPVTRFAAYYHDMIYDPQRSDNEEQSAKQAEMILRVLRVAEADDVAAVVRATATHELHDDDPVDTASFLDADLAILGKGPEAYDEYSRQIRAEYIHMAPEDFRAGRVQVLNSFQDRAALFFTPAGKDLWEAQARTNIARELNVLTSWRKPVT